MTAFRFAIMGAGNIARRFCDAVAQTEGCEVAAAASKSMERARALAREKGIPRAFDSYARMLEEVRPDAVYIAATCDAHYDLAVLCVRHGVPVLCEKAMFMSSAEADAFFALAASKRVFAMEALWSRFLPAVNRAREWVREGRVGELAMAQMSIGFAAPRDPENRYFNPKLGGGAAYDLTVYGLQILTWVLDRPITRAQVQVTAARTGVDAASIVLLDLGGLPATVHSSLISPMDEALIVTGAQGRIVVPHAHYGSEALLLAGDGSMIYHFRDAAPVDGFTYEIGEVIRCVRSGALESPVVPHAATRACAAVYDRIRDALASS